MCVPRWLTDDGLCVAREQPSVDSTTFFYIFGSLVGVTVSVAGRFEMGAFHSLPAVGFQVTENDQEKSAGGRQLKPSLCVCSPPSKLLKKDAKSCLCPLLLFSLPFPASLGCLVWTRDAGWFGGSLPLNRENLDLDPALVNSRENAHAVFVFPCVLGTRALVQTASLGHELRGIPV